MQKIDRETLKKDLEAEDNLTVLNVLSQKDYNKEHIVGSLNVPQEDDRFVDKVLNMVTAKDKPIVVYCASTECLASSEAAKKLESAGFTNVRAYEGGMKDWKAAGYPTEGNA